MKIPSEEIEVKEIAGKTKDGEPIVYVETKGGLHAFFCKKNEGVEAIGIAPHKEIAKFFAEKKNPDIVWNSSFLSKSESSPEQEMFDKLRSFLFLKTEPIEQNPQDVYVVYNTKDKEISLVKHEELHEDLSKFDEYSLIRDLACTEEVKVLKDIKDRFLEKMSRPRITFPNLLSGKDSRPDQNVQLIETNRQKDLFGRKVANAHIKDRVAPQSKWTIGEDGSSQHTTEQVKVSNQASRDKTAKTFSNVFNRHTLGMSVPTKQGPVSAALGGKTRSKFEEVKDPEHSVKMAEHHSKKASALKDYSKTLSDWYNAPYATRGPRPEKPKMPRKPSVPKVDTKNLGQKEMKERGSAVGATLEHEGFHDIMSKISTKYGKEAESKIIDKLMSHHTHSAMMDVGTFIANKLGYKPKSPKFKEEMLAHARDILVNPKKRRDFTDFITKQSGDPEKAKKTISEIKRGHHKAYKFAQGLKSLEEQKEQQVSTKTAADKIEKGEKLVHFSPMENLIEVDPSKMGTSGVGGMQYKRGLPEHKSSFFYSNTSEPESLVTQKAPHKYEAELEDHHKVYDFKNDPEQLIQEQKARNGGAYNEDMLHGIIKEKGYHGVKWMMNPKTTVFQMYSPMKVKKV